MGSLAHQKTLLKDINDNVHQHQAVQSQAAYKGLLTRQIIDASGNCIVRDETKILDVLRDSTAENDTVVSCADISITRKYMIDTPTCIEDHNSSEIPQIIQLSEYKEAAKAYLAGYAVVMIK